MEAPRSVIEPRFQAGLRYTPIETLFNLQGLIFGNIFTVMRQES